MSIDIVKIIALSKRKTRIPELTKVLSEIPCGSMCLNPNSSYRNELPIRSATIQAIINLPECNNKSNIYLTGHAIYFLCNTCGHNVLLTGKRNPTELLRYVLDKAKVLVRIKRNGRTCENCAGPAGACAHGCLSAES